ncbi:hypothetical protein T281_03475 [Rhodomicrobium udaipurense JA643]|uniref:Bacterial transcription activator effector binding domain-containing protein n=1 Tax=Rhodomicrobium udaipurense TaxID=1202716 RepID=A0A8I1GHM6_9HYPH|nr:hypothetical protein [Rhodomicrobium udaipurense]KAI95816.1 hypothetical protein T281_03475 [Rhodomicrobium udaipurense JA643]MBJ7543620.1 hypothetical protein [Rhodomicrobium udaipurense]
MQIKETPDMWALRLTKRLCIPEVKQAGQEYGRIIENAIASADLTPSGPWLFIAQNLPKTGKTPFDWAICRPIERPNEYRGAIELVHLEPIIVASAVHQGSLRTLFTQGYAPLVAEIERSRHVFSGESREIYHDWNGPGAAYHRIEIQFGLSR